MRKAAIKKYFAAALILLSVFLIFGANFAHAQDDFGPPPIDSPIVTGPVTSPSSPASPASPSSPTAPATGNTGLSGLSAAQTAATKSLNWYSCFTSALTCSVYGISNVINWFLNLLVQFGAILINVGLFLDGQVFNSPTVQTGFSVSLAIANLGFVLGIIVIALATILRNETYGIKQMLWKLIVMAILVNFGLVICGPIVGLADSFTNYFLTASGGASKFSNELGQAFAPQTLFAPPISPAASAPVVSVTSPAVTCPGQGESYGYTTNEECSGSQKAILTDDANNSSGADEFVREVLSLLFSAAFLAITALTFITIGILLIIRYLYLAILLILLPFAWLMWIFPKFNHHFGEWWSLFIKWTLFPAISLFFIYLAFQSVTVASNGSASVNVLANSNLNNGGTATQNQNDPVLGFLETTGSAGSLLNTALDELLMCGLCLGGLYAANAMSIKGADTALHAASWAGGKVKGYAAKQTKKGARATYQAAGGSKITQNLQSGNIGALKRIPLVGGALQRGASYAGQGLSRFEKAGGKNLVEGEMKWAQEFGKNPKEGARLLEGSLSTERQIALLKVLTASKDLGEVKSINGERLGDYIKKNKDTFEQSYGEGDFYNRDFKKASGNIQVDDAANAVGTGHPEQQMEMKDDNGETISVTAMEKLTRSMNDFASGLKKADVSKMDMGYMFDSKNLEDPANEIRMKTFLQKIALTNTQIVPGMWLQMKGKQQKEFKKLYESAIAKERADATGRNDHASLETLQKAKDAFESILDRQASYMGGGGSGGGGDAGASGGLH